MALNEPARVTNYLYRVKHHGCDSAAERIFELRSELGLFQKVEQDERDAVPGRPHLTIEVTIHRSTTPRAS
jgi:hypothetical protein